MTRFSYSGEEQEILSYYRLPSNVGLSKSPNYLPYSPVSTRFKKDWLQHLRLLKQNQRSEIWVLYGSEGCGKTSTANGIGDTVQQMLDWVVTSQIGEVADLLIIDDVRYFNKRSWQGKKGAKFLVFVRTVRSLYSLTIMTAPSWQDLDVAVRESQIMELVLVVRPGFAIWRYPISVVPRWIDEEWRKDVALDLASEIVDI